MTVKSRTTGPTTQVLSGATAAAVLVFILQAIAVLLVVASTFGNYVQFVGGWPTEPDKTLPFVWAAVLYATVYQVGCAIAQWGCKHKGWWIAYTIALLVSAIPSFFTYNAWAGPWLTVLIGPILSTIVIGLIVLFGDMIPEWILVD